MCIKPTSGNATNISVSTQNISHCIDALRFIIDSGEAYEKPCGGTIALVLRQLESTREELGALAGSENQSK